MLHINGYDDCFFFVASKSKHFGWLAKKAREFVRHLLLQATKTHANELRYTKGILFCTKFRYDEFEKTKS